MIPRPGDHDREALIRKIETRLSRLPGERRVLEAGLSEISPDHDIGPFVDAYNSARDRDLMKVRAVERSFEVIHNYVVEIVQYCLDLEGELGRESSANAPRDINNAKRLGRLNQQLATQVIRLHEVRGGLQHWYPDMVGQELHRGITDLLKVFAPLLAALQSWFTDAR